MQITVKAIELNARTNGDIAHINGVAVEIENLQIKGSEKQIAWAQQIAKDAIRLAAEEIIKKKTDNGMMIGAELDAFIGRVNADLNQNVAPRLDGKHAKAWIDNRDDAGSAILRAVAKSN